MYFLLKRVKKNLVIGFSRRACRNFFGRKTIYTQSGGLTFKLRLIDYKRNLINRGIVLQVEKNITHTALLGLVFFENGLYSYILLSNQNQYKNTSVFGFINKFVMDRPTFIGNIPTGILVYNVEILPGNGGKYIRAAGNSSFIISRDNIFTYLKLNSG
jgi:large subunit ribosomal protein L2